MTTKPSPEQRAQDLFRAAGPSEPLSPETLESLWRRTEPKLKPRPWAGRLPKIALVTAVAGATLWWFASRAPATVPVATTPPLPATAPVVQARAEPPPAPAPARAVETVPALGGSAPAPAPRPHPAVVPATKPAEPPGAEAPTAEDPLLAESRLIARAVKALRDEHDANAALATLDEYGRQFSHGVLAREAELARVEALVAAGQRTEALNHLETMNLSASPRGAELRVLQGELLSERGRCDDAVAQFELASQAALSHEAEERAVYGKARCLRDPEAQRREFERYLRQFPHGRYADQVRTTMEPTEPSPVP